MATVWIVDTSPFIGLAKIGRLDLLAAPTRQVWIADVVECEALAGVNADKAVAALREGWDALAQTGFVRRASLAPPPPLAARRLDAGEEAVLSLALQQPGSVAIMDDSAGRAAAKALGIPAVGTVGVLLQARQEQRLTEIAPLLRDLQAAGLFLPREGLLTALLAGLGETWP